MALIALVSAKGSPGVTTTALALSHAWPDVYPGRRVLIAECDAGGGDIATGYLRGHLDESRGLLALSAQRHENALDGVWKHVLALDDEGKRLLLPGLIDPSRAAVIATAYSTLSAALEELVRQDPPIDVLIDLGRIRTAYEAVQIRQQADLILLVTKSSLSAVAAARAAAAELLARSAGDGSPRVAIVVIGEGRPYKAQEVGDVLGLPVLGAVAYDVASAAVFSTGAAPGRHFRRSELVRSSRALARTLVGAANGAIAEGTAPAVLAPAGAGRG